MRLALTAVTDGRNQRNETDVTLTIDEHLDSDWLVIVLGGDLDLYTVPELRSTLSAALDAISKRGDRPGRGRDGRGAAREVVDTVSDASRAHGVALRGLVVDIEAVAFMDSAGLGVLVWAHKRARSENTRLQLVGASPLVIKLFQITGLSRVFQMQPSLAVALADEN